MRKEGNEAVHKRETERKGAAGRKRTKEIRTKERPTYLVQFLAYTGFVVLNTGLSVLKLFLAAERFDRLEVLFERLFQVWYRERRKVRLVLERLPPFIQSHVKRHNVCEGRRQADTDSRAGAFEAVSDTTIYYTTTLSMV